jgi:uncharacterized protein with HEPN domain
MAEYIEEALRFVEGRSRGDLDTDTMLRFALLRAVEVVGEAASQVSEEGRAALPDVPWRKVVGMRNRLVHAYFDIDHDILWDTVTLALPALLEYLKSRTQED